MQGGFQKCRDREAKRLERMQAEVQGGWEQCREKRGLRSAQRVGTGARQDAGAGKKL